MRTISKALALLLVAAGLVLAPGHQPADAQGSFDQELIRLANSHRASIGRAPLVSSSTLSSGSLSWSRTMRDTGNFQHAPGLGMLGENIGYALGFPGAKFAVTWSTAAGPLPGYCTNSMDYSSAAFMMCQWLSSSSHRTSIENPSYRQVGSGTATNSGTGGVTVYSTMRFSFDSPPNNVAEPGHSVATNDDGDTVFVALKNDGALWIRRNLGSGWSSWTTLGQGNWASADVAIAPNGTAQVVAVKATGQLSTVSWSPSGSFSDWTDHGGGWATRTRPSIAATNGRVVLGAITAGGDLHTKTQSGGWTAPSVHGASGWATVDVDIAADGDIWFAGVKRDGRLYVRKNLEGRWSGFALMGAATWSASTPPAIAARSNGVIFAAVKSDGRLYTREQAGGRWQDWVRHGVSSWSAVDIDMSERGNVWLGGTKSWGQLYTHERTPSGGWMPWGRHGRATWSAKATPSISVADGNRPVLIAVKADGSLYFRARSSSAWGSWLRLGAGQWAPGF